MSALRIQRKRTKGWRMPEGAVYVGRPTRWGNPFSVVNGYRQGWLVFPPTGGFIGSYETKQAALAGAVREYENAVSHDRTLVYLDVIGREAQYLPLHRLRGRDLACWCPLDQPCHADVLLRLANRIEATA